MEKNPTKMLTGIEAYQQATNKLAQKYADENGKKYVHFLISSFVLTPVKYILYSKSELKDFITGSKVLPLHTEEFPVQDQEIKDAYVTFIKSMKINPDSELTHELENKFQQSLREYILANPRQRIAVRSESGKILGIEEYQAVCDFVQDQIKSKNKTIKKMVSYSKKSNTKPIQKSTVQDSEQVMEAKLNLLLEKYKK